MAESSRLQELLDRFRGKDGKKPAQWSPWGDPQKATPVLNSGSVSAGMKNTPRSVPKTTSLAGTGWTPARTPIGPARQGALEAGRQTATGLPPQPTPPRVPPVAAPQTPTPGVGGGIYGATPFTNPGQGQSARSPFTGAEIGLSPWGQPLTGQLNEEQKARLRAQNQDLYQQILNAGQNKFGVVEDSAVLNLVNKVVNEGMPLQEALARLSGGHGIDPDRQRAGDLVEMEYQPQVNALNRLIELINANTNRDVSAQQHYGNFGDQRLQEIYSSLDRSLNNNNQQISRMYNQGRQQMQEIYGGGAESIQQANTQMTDQMRAEAERLGLSAALPEAAAPATADLARLTAQMQAGGAGAAGNLAALGTNMGAIGVRARSDASREGAQSRANLVNNVSTGITDVQNAGRQQLYEAFGELSDLNSTRGAALRSAYQEILEARTERERQAALDKFAQQIQERTIGLQENQQRLDQSRWQQEFGLTREQFDFQKEEARFQRTLQIQDMGLKRQQLEMQQRELQVAIQNQAQMAPFERAQAQAQLNQINAEIDKIRAQTDATRTGAQTDAARAGAELALTEAQIDKIAAETRLTREEIRTMRNPGAQTPARYQNQQGREQFYADFKVPPMAQAAINGLVLEAQAQKAQTGVDPYSYALNAILTDPKYRIFPQDTMVTAINIEFGQHATFKD